MLLFVANMQSCPSRGSLFPRDLITISKAVLVCLSSVTMNLIPDGYFDWPRTSFVRESEWMSNYSSIYQRAPSVGTGWPTCALTPTGFAGPRRSSFWWPGSSTSNDRWSSISSTNSCGFGKAWPSSTQAPRRSKKNSWPENSPSCHPGNDHQKLCPSWTWFMGSRGTWSSYQKMDYFPWTILTYQAFPVIIYELLRGRSSRVV